MPRFLIRGEEIRDNLAVLAGENVKHIRRVLRLGVGDEVILFDEAGWEYHAKIIDGNSKEIKVDVFRKFLPHRESPLEIILGQGLPRLPKMDFIVQKGTELGVSGILPFNSRRSIPKLSDEKIIRKMGRWRKIALEATKQCGRNLVPHIGSPIDFTEILAMEFKDSLKFILWEGERVVGIKEILDMSLDKNRFLVLVGPEGGFTNREIHEAKEAGFKVVSMGNRILRSETAGISILSVIQYKFGDLN